MWFMWCKMNLCGAHYFPCPFYERDENKTPSKIGMLMSLEMFLLFDIMFFPLTFCVHKIYYRLSLIMDVYDLGIGAVIGMSVAIHRFSNLSV